MLLIQCKSRPNIEKNGISGSQKDATEISFTEYEHNFGKIKEGEKISWQFTFENKGQSDLVLLSVTTSCGCTVPEYDANPIKPGSSGTIDVVFDTSGRNGMQTKVITVRSNASVPVVLLKITAEVGTQEK
jgi:hypothetical protein